MLVAQATTTTSELKFYWRLERQQRQMKRWNNVLVVVTNQLYKFHIPMCTLQFKLSGLKDVLLVWQLTGDLSLFVWEERNGFSQSNNAG
jgi:hypothetical protein